MLVNVSKEASVNVSFFNAHSTKSAASSKASDKGLNLAETSKAAGWSNAGCSTRKLLVKTLGSSY